MGSASTNFASVGEEPATALTTPWPFQLSNSSPPASVAPATRAPVPRNLRLLSLLAIDISPKLRPRRSRPTRREQRPHWHGKRAAPSATNLPVSRCLCVCRAAYLCHPNGIFFYRAQDFYATTAMREDT